MKQEVGPQLQARVDDIRDAIRRADDRFDPALSERAHVDLDRLLQRLELGVDHAVVALVGGTGSGKSSMFNAITTLAFADVGVIRPTTSQAAACVWGQEADKLLDFLQVAPNRRFLRESLLTGSDEADLRGLVLLDLPDHDSVATGHAELVNRLLPLIDLLVWIVDPQKYADNALHEGYLRELSDRHEAMLVVVNQVDTLTEAGAKAVREDVGRLLADDGLADVPVILASARTGEGVDAVRDHLRRVLANESMAARTARDELTAISKRVSAGVGTREPALAATAATSKSLAEIAGVPAVTNALRAAIASPTPVVTSSVQTPSRSRVDAVRQNWLATATQGLPQRWSDAITSATASPEDFVEHATAAIKDVPLPSAREERAALARRIGIVFAVLAGAVLIAAAVIYLALSQQLLGLACAAGAVVLAAVALVLMLSARSRRRRAAEQRSSTYRSDVTAAVNAVIEKELRLPASEVLADHAKVRSLLAQ